MSQLKICYWNANGLSQHKLEVEQFLHTEGIDLLLDSETHLTVKNCFRIKGYYSFDTKRPSGRACGGSAIIVKKNVKDSPMPEFKEDFFQHNYKHIRFKYRNFICLLPPNTQN